MQFRGHSLQSMRVSWDFFSLSHFVSQFPPTRFPLLTAIGMCHFLPVHHLEWHFGPGRRSKYNKRFCRKRPALFKSSQWHFQQNNAPVHKSILVTDYLTKMGIKTVPHPPYSPDLAPCDFWLFPKLRGCGYETIEEIIEAVTKVIDTLTQEDFHGAFQKLLERYKCIVAGGYYFDGD